MKPFRFDGQSRRPSVVVGIRLTRRWVSKPAMFCTFLLLTNVWLELASGDVIHSFWIAGMKE